MFDPSDGWFASSEVQQGCVIVSVDGVHASQVHKDSVWVYVREITVAEQVTANDA